jgi:SAM-dependent methyltransferase
MTDSFRSSPGDTEAAVRSRYSAAAGQREEALCCPVDYDPRYLEVIPQEVLERDYGCGDPSRFVREGETVLDLGSGGGKICFIAAQVAGPKGRVIGVDVNDEMLALARRSAPQVAERLGFENVEFRRGRIQDLALCLDRLDAWLARNPVRSSEDWSRLEAQAAELRREAPLVASGSVDLVVSNCVLNLVHPEDKDRLFREMHRVLKLGGRIAISDIVSDEPVPAHLRANPELWSGCVSGALEEREFLEHLAAAGFHGIRVESFEHQPFAVAEGIEFRSLTVTAHKGDRGPGDRGACLEANQAVVYRGPWKQVEDDEGHVLRRGERTAVCARSFETLTSEPYRGELVPIEPRVPVPEEGRPSFDCQRAVRREPRESKGADYRETRSADPNTGSCC